MPAPGRLCSPLSFPGRQLPPLQQHHSAGQQLRLKCLQGLLPAPRRPGRPPSPGRHLAALPRAAEGSGTPRAPAPPCIPARPCGAHSPRTSPAAASSHSTSSRRPIAAREGRRQREQQQQQQHGSPAADPREPPRTSGGSAPSCARLGLGQSPLPSACRGPGPGAAAASRGDAAPRGSAGKEAREESPLPAGQPSPARWHLPRRQRRASRPPPGACPSPPAAAVPPRARSSPGGHPGSRAGRPCPALPCRGEPSWDQRRALAGTWLRAGFGEAGGGNVVSVLAWWVRPQQRCEANGAGVGCCVQMQEKQLWLKCMGPSAWQTHAWVKGCQSACLV